MNSLSQYSDEKLCELVSHGDTEAEEYLVARYGRVVRICARPYFLAGGDSEDLIQEGMIGLLSAIRSYRPNEATTFRTYAETCIRNRMYSAIRSAAQGKHTPLNSSVSLEAEHLNEAVDISRRLLNENPEDTLIGREEQLDRLSVLSKNLSKFEKIVLGWYLKGYSYTQIAEMTGKSHKAVDNAVQRIRHKAAAYPFGGDNSES